MKWMPEESYEASFIIIMKKLLLYDTITIFYHSFIEKEHSWQDFVNIAKETSSKKDV